MTSTRILAVHATNLKTGGGRTILLEMLRALINDLPSQWHIRLFVGDIQGLPVSNRLSVETHSNKAGAWFTRASFEFFGLARALKSEPPDLLLSLQGSSPRAPAARTAVYVHNTIPLGPWTLWRIYIQPGMAIRSFIYHLLYWFQLGRQDLVIVQQEWFRVELRKRYGHERTIVARPIELKPASVRPIPVGKRPFRLLYPCAAYPFKNIEVLGDALRILEERQPGTFEAHVTINGDENRYARWLRARYDGLAALTFVGQIPFAEIADAYARTDLLVFPSAVESWGLPLSEAAAVGLPVLAPDLPYAREALDGFEGVAFFRPEDPSDAAMRILDLWNGATSLEAVHEYPPAPPFARNWSDLVVALVEYADGDLAGVGR